MTDIVSGAVCGAKVAKVLLTSWLEVY